MDTNKHESEWVHPRSKAAARYPRIPPGKLWLEIRQPVLEMGPVGPATERDKLRFEAQSLRCLLVAVNRWLALLDGDLKTAPAWKRDRLKGRKEGLEQVRRWLQEHRVE